MVVPIGADRPTFLLRPRSPVGLAIEVIGREGSMAILIGDQVDWSTSFGHHQRSASEIGDALRIARHRLEHWRAKPKAMWSELPLLDYVAVATGPGSFTGLRIAVTCAKAFAYATNVPVVPIDSLTAIAVAIVNSRVGVETLRSDPSRRHLLVAVNAYRGQVFVSEFSLTNSDPAGLVTVSEATDVRSAEQWTAQLAAMSEPCWVAGDAAVFAKSLAGDGFPGRWVEGDSWGIGVGFAAARILRELPDAAVSAMSILPNYFRPSAAEEQSPLAK